MTHLNLNDQTNEGMRVRGVPAFSVQYHPEARAARRRTCDVRAMMTLLRTMFADLMGTRR